MGMSKVAILSSHQQCPSPHGKVYVLRVMCLSDMFPTGEPLKQEGTGARVPNRPLAPPWAATVQDSGDTDLSQKDRETDRFGSCWLDLLG